MNSAYDAAVVLFHGLGLSHMDVEQSTASGGANADWRFQAGMVVPLHVVYPGGEPFGWGYEPLLA